MDIFSIVGSIFTIIAAIVSVLSFLNLYLRNRKRLIIEFNDFKPDCVRNIYAFNPKVQDTRLISSVRENSELTFLSIQIINTSKSDIGYYAMRLVQTTNNYSFSLITNESFSLLDDENSLWFDLIIKKGNESKHSYIQLELPSDFEGVFKANSITKIDFLFLSPYKRPFNIQLSFQITKDNPISFFSKNKLIIIKKNFMINDTVSSD